MLELEGVSKSYDGRTVLAPTDLVVPRGQTTVLIGPSGCGKSTLIRLMIGLIRPDSGPVRFKATEITPLNARQLRLEMGYVVQDGGLFPHLTAEQNVTLVARYFGWDEERIRFRLADLMKLTQFPADGLGRYPLQISGGQRQRVSLMRALMLDPELLLLDEPLGALDPIIRSELQADLRRIFQTLGKTVVLVTHDLGEAGYLGDLIVLMREGRVVQKGTLTELVHKPADPFVTRFVNAQRTRSKRSSPWREPHEPTSNSATSDNSRGGGSRPNGDFAAVLIWVFWREPRVQEPRVHIGIGSKPFTESVILGDMVQHLVEHAGDTTEHRQAGGTRIVAEHRRQLVGTRVRVGGDGRWQGRRLRGIHRHPGA